MARHLTQEKRDKIRELAEKGYSKARIMNYIDITLHQLEFALKKMEIKIARKELGGFYSVYKLLKGR